MIRQIPELDDRLRSVCEACGFVDYENPKMVVGTIPESGNQILLCKRNIEPQKGFWTLPAGFMENDESVQEGAARETFEESNCQVEIISPYRLYNIVHVNQIYFMFRAKLITHDFKPTKESTQVRLFKEAEIPWDDIAFLVIGNVLKEYFKDRKKSGFPFKVKDLIIK